MKRLLTAFIFLTFLSCKNNNSTGNIEGPKKGIQNKNWAGTWKREMWQNSASLEIKGNNSDSIEFKLFAFNGGNTGEVAGKAVIKNNKGTYYLADENDTCLLTFEIFGDTLIMINQSKGSCFAGMGVEYTGKYYNLKFKSKTVTKANDKKKNEETLLSMGIFYNTAEDSIFKQLTGKDYDIFLNSTQLIAEEDDLDSLHTRVKSSGVRGLYTIMENIIMIDSSKNIWAAVIDDNKVLYYTSNPDYKNKLPKTIEAWRSGFKDYPVIYKSGN